MFSNDELPPAPIDNQAVIIDSRSDAGSYSQEMQTAQYKTLARARLEMTNQVCAFKDLVRTGQPFSQGAIRTIAWEMSATFLRLDDAIEPYLPTEVRQRHAILKSTVARSA